MSMPNRSRWLDGGWNNYLLWIASEVSRAARAVGETEWAAVHAETAAGLWVPKDDHACWVMACGSTLESLSPVRRAEARRIADVELALLRRSEVLHGLPWHDTPYDTHAYTVEAARMIQGFQSVADPDALDAAERGLRFLVSRQSSHGGWGSTLSLLDVEIDPDQPGWVPPHELATGETPEADAEVVLALARGLAIRPCRPAS